MARGAMEPGREVTGYLTRKHIYEIAKIKSQVIHSKYIFFFPYRYNVQHCFICRPSDSTVPTDAGIEPRTVATSALAVRRSNHQARSHPFKLFQLQKMVCIDLRVR